MMFAFLQTISIGFRLAGVFLVNKGAERCTLDELVQHLGESLSGYCLLEFIFYDPPRNKPFSSSLLLASQVDRVFFLPNFEHCNL